MRTGQRFFNKIRSKNFNLEPQFNICFDEVRDNYHKFLKGYETVKLKKVLSIQSVKKAAKGDLIAETKYFNQLKIYILDKDVEKNVTKIRIKDRRISKTYLLWVFGQKPIYDYINLFRIGTVISYVPLSAILDIKIPIRKKHDKGTSLIFQGQGKFRDIIENYLISDLQICREKNLNLAAIVLAGSVIESIISQLLMDHGIKEGHLENKTLGQLIKFAKIEGVMEKDLLTSIEELNGIRNHIHANKLIKKEVNMAEKARRCFELFDNIIKEVGI